MPEAALGQLEIRGARVPDIDRVLTPKALAFVRRLHDEFDGRRRQLLAAREAREARLLEGELPGFLDETRHIRTSDWQVAPTPEDLQRRTVEITGPVDRKMMINALNSGADAFMADLEDSLSPTWENVIGGQANLQDAVRRTLELTTPEGKEYRLNDDTATLLVRPRGWHLPEKHLLADGRPLSASLVDFGLHFFHNAREAVERGTGPYYYLPKLESHLEARLWNDVFEFAQDEVGLPSGTIRATVLIENVLAAFEMEEILYELREHMAGLNAGRWDYIFSVIKKFREQEDFLLPDRGQVTMTVPFMRAYTELLVRACHRRGAHAMGGMAAFIPTRRDPDVNERAMRKVREDKIRESRDGFDGTWIAHPGLVSVAREAFREVLGEEPHQKDRTRSDVDPDEMETQLLDVRVPDGTISRDGVAQNVSVALLYIDSWLRGIGAAAIFNLMEDAATAEISRAQLWQWCRHGARLEDGTTMSEAIYYDVREEQLARLKQEGLAGSRIDEAADLLDGLVTGRNFPSFLTLPGYERLD